jgi:hypothetical protein
MLVFLKEEASRAYSNPLHLRGRCSSIVEQAFDGFEIFDDACSVRRIDR